MSKRRLPKVHYQAGMDIAAFLIMNPIILLVLIAIIFIAGGSVITSIFSNIVNIWVWMIVIPIAVFIRPQKSMPIFAILVGIIPWGYQLYLEMTAWAAWCNIPIIGWLTCIFKDMVTLPLKIFSLLTFIASAYIMLFISTAIVLLILGQRER